MNLLDRRYVAYGLREIEEIRAGIPDCPGGICETTNSGETMMDAKLVDEIVAKIIARMQAVN